MNRTRADIKHWLLPRLLPAAMILSSAGVVMSFPQEGGYVILRDSYGDGGTPTGMSGGGYTLRSAFAQPGGVGLYTGRDSSDSLYELAAGFIGFGFGASVIAFAITGLNVTNYYAGFPSTRAIIANITQEPDLTSFSSLTSFHRIRDNQGESIDETIPLQFTYSEAAGTMQLQPETSSLLKNSTYRLTIAGDAISASGVPLGDTIVRYFRTIADRSVVNVIKSWDSLTSARPLAQVTLPANALSGDYYLDIRHDLLTNRNPDRVTLSQITDANTKLGVFSGGGFRAAGAASEINPYDSSGQYLASDFSSTNVQVCLSYADMDKDNNGIVDGTQARVTSLKVNWLNESANLWTPVPNSTVDTSNQLVCAKPAHFSVFAAISAPLMSVADAYAFPVPFRPSLGHQAITFTNLASENTITIYTVAGDLVKSASSSGSTGQYVWDVKNNDGKTVVSGVYIYVIESTGGDKKIGKLMIIR